LGDFTKYRYAVYRVFYPRSDGSRGRVLVVTNFAPLAMIAGNVYEYISDVGKEDNLIFLNIFAPITLASSIVKDDTDYLKQFKDYIDDIDKLMDTLVTELAKHTSKWRDLKCANKELCEFLKNEIRAMMEKEGGRENMELILVDLENIKSIDETRYTSSSCEKIELPRIKFYEAELVFKLIKNNDTLEKRLKIYIGLVLVPLTGSFPIGNPKKSKYRVVFREASGKDIEVFNIVSKTICVDGIKRLIEKESSMLKKNSLKNVKILVDTTHGLNQLTVEVVNVFNEVSPLVYNEILSHDLELKKMLFYNSDPYPPGLRDDCESIEYTLKYNLSYYYLVEEISTLTTRLNKLLSETDTLLFKNRDSLGGFIDIIKGVYLLRHGLIPWGLSYIDSSQQVKDSYRAYVELIKPSKPLTQLKDKTIVEIKYKCIERNPQLYTMAVSKWIASLMYRMVKKILEDENIKLLIGDGTKCWEEGDTSIHLKYYRCYSLRGLKDLMFKKELAQTNWAVGLLRGIVEDTALIIYDRELKEWGDDPLKRISYWLPHNVIFERVKGECSQIFGKKQVEVTYCGRTVKAYCVTPMRIQDEIRNIIAHAGLTSVNRFVTALFTDRDGKCEAFAICIPSSFPFSELKKVVNELRKR